MGSSNRPLAAAVPVATTGTAQQTLIDAPWSRHSDEVLALLGSDGTIGLSPSEAARRLQAVGPNTLQQQQRSGVLAQVRQQLREPFVLLLLIAIVVSTIAWLVEDSGEVAWDPIVISLVVVVNTVLGVWQERRAETAVAALQRMTSTRTRVIRGGQQTAVPSEELVPGDLVLLEEGDAVGADLRLTAVESLHVAEAALTGESHPVTKSVEPVAGELAGDRFSMAFAGTAVTSGHGRGVVTATGMSAEMGTIAQLLGSTDVRPSPLQQELRRVGRGIGIAVIAVAVGVVLAILVTSTDRTVDHAVDALLIGVSMAVAAVPEGLPAILVVVLGMGVQRMAGRGALVKQLSSVETLGSTSIVCTDKTGTMTRNEMTVTEIVTASGSTHLSGVGYAPAGDLRPASGPGPAVLAEARTLLALGSLACNAEVERSDGGWTALGDPTEAALVVAARKADPTEHIRASHVRVAEAPFSSDRKMMSTVHREPDGDRRHVLVVTKGAPDVLLRRCGRVRTHAGERELTSGDHASWSAVMDRMAGRALRPLGIATKRVDHADHRRVEDLESDLVFLGIVGMIDPPREEAREAIAAARGAGVRIQMITGDHPGTAAEVANQLGLATEPETVISGLDIDAMSDEELADAVVRATVFARVSPHHKLRIVSALQAQQEIVAMTGDGVNDAPALRHADIGVAMGVTGTEVAKDAANMILTDDDIETILAGIEEGRRIFANIAKFLRYLLPSNAAEVLVMLVGVVAGSALGLRDVSEGLAVPLLATQILWINLLTDSGLALALGVDIDVDDVMSRPPRRLGDPMIDGSMVMTIISTGAVMALSGLVALDLELPGGFIEGAGTLESARTHLFTVLVLASILVAFNSRSSRRSAFTRLLENGWLWFAAGVALVLQVAVVHVPVLQEAFTTEAMSVRDWLVALALSSSVLWVEELRKWVVRRREQATGQRRAGRPSLGRPAGGQLIADASPDRSGRSP